MARNGGNGFKNVFHSRLYYFDLLQNGNSNFGFDSKGLSQFKDIKYYVWDLRKDKLDCPCLYNNVLLIIIKWNLATWILQEMIVPL